jgi:hypothetical protein
MRMTVLAKGLLIQLMRKERIILIRLRLMRVVRGGADVRVRLAVRERVGRVCMLMLMGLWELVLVQA